MKLCSACLLGIKCEWDGKDRYKNEKIISLSKKELLIPVCPEQLGGLPTPRTPMEIIGGDGFTVLDKKAKLIDKNKIDKTSFLIHGAKEVLYTARIYGITQFIGKEMSPSCGVKYIYDGTFTGNKKKGKGIVSAFLERNGIKVISEEDIRQEI